MKTIFIWWHRRRAAWHNGIKHYGASPFNKCWNYHVEWANWHLDQIKRLVQINEMGKSILKFDYQSKYVHWKHLVDDLK